MRPVDHVPDLVEAAENLDGLGMPGGALLGQAAGFVFRVAGLQRGLLGQLQRFDRGGWPAVVALELGRRAHPAGRRCGPVGSTSAG